MKFLSVILLVAVTTLHLIYVTGKTPENLPKDDQSTSTFDTPGTEGETPQNLSDDAVPNDDESTSNSDTFEGKTRQNLPEDDQSTSNSDATGAEGKTPQNLPEDPQIPNDMRESTLSSDTLEAEGELTPYVTEDAHSFINGNIFKGIFRKGKKILKGIRRKHHYWSPKRFISLIKKLGIFTGIKSLKMYKASARLIRALKKKKNHIIDMYKKKPECNQEDGAEGREMKTGEDKNHDKRRGLHDLCPETFSNMIILAHERAGLVYQIQNAHCAAKECVSRRLRMPIGKCVRKKKTIVLYVLNKNMQFVPKTVVCGCACECLHYSFII